MSAALRPVTTATFDADVLAAPRPVLACFWAGWCAPCRAVGPLAEAVAAGYAGRADVGSVDVDAEAALADRYGGRGGPTFVVFDGGRPVDGVVGAVARGSLTSRLDARITAVPAGA